VVAVEALLDALVADVLAEDADVDAEVAESAANPLDIFA